MKNFQEYVTLVEAENIATQVGRGIGGAETTAKQTASDIEQGVTQAGADLAAGYKAGLAGETPQGAAPSTTPAQPPAKSPFVMIGNASDPVPQGYKRHIIKGQPDKVYFGRADLSDRYVTAWTDHMKSTGQQFPIAPAPATQPAEVPASGAGASNTAVPPIRLGTQDEPTPEGYKKVNFGGQVIFAPSNMSSADIDAAIEANPSILSTDQIAAEPAPAAATSGKPEVPNEVLTKTSNFSWKEIYDLNKATIGNNPNLIKPGQVLKLPNGQPYTVKSGDNLNKIAKAAGGSSSTAKPGSGGQKAAALSPQVKANREAGKPDWYEPEDYARDEKIQGLVHPEKQQTAYQKGVAKEKDQLAQMAKLAGVKLPNMSTSAGPQSATANAGGLNVSAGPQGASANPGGWPDINAAHNNWRPSAADVQRAREAEAEFQKSDGSNAEYDKISRALQASRPAYIPEPLDQQIDNVVQAQQAARQQSVRENVELDRITTLINYK